MTDRAGNSSFWTTIKSLALASTVTAEQLYTLGLDKLTDRTVWLRDEITRRTAALAAVTAGTTAALVGSVDLSTLTYDATSGDLNGLTFQIQADTGGAKTVTFGSGGSAPLSPADVVAQILAATSGQPSASVDSAGHLNVGSTTTGGGSTITIVGGSACTLLGFTASATASGVSSGGEGASLVGVSAYSGTQFTIAAGTLTTFLRLLADKAAAFDTNYDLAIPAQTETRVMNCEFFGDPTDVLPDIVYGRATFQTTGGTAYAYLDIPHEVSLTSIEVYIDPASGHGGVAPSNMPAVTWTALDITTNTAIAGTGGTVTDATSIGSYEANHAITVSGAGVNLPYTMDRTKVRAAIAVTNESTGSAQAGLKIAGVRASWARTKVGRD